MFLVYFFKFFFLKVRMNVRINLKRQSRMHIPGTQAALITRPRTKTNKTKHGTESQKYYQHGHQNAGMNPCAHEGYNGAYFL